MTISGIPRLLKLEDYSLSQSIHQAEGDMTTHTEASLYY